jgi:hypothetical protein
MIQPCDPAPFQSTIAEKENPMLEHVFIGRADRRYGVAMGPYSTTSPPLYTTKDTPAYSALSAAGDRFGPWLQGQGDVLSEMDEAVSHRYVSGLQRYRSGHLPKAAQGLNHLWRFLQRQGVVRQQHAVTPSAPLDQWLAEYDPYLAQVVT